MTEFKDLNWGTLNFVRSYLFQQLAAPVGMTIDYIGESDEQKRQAKVDETRFRLDMMKNLIETWGALIAWKSVSDDDAVVRQKLKSDEFPDWFLDYLGQRGILKAEHTQNMLVHPPAFYQAVMLLVDVAGAVGEVSHIMLNDAAKPRSGVWLRVVFVPPNEKPFQSKLAILDSIDKSDPNHEKIATHFAVVEELLELNKTRFSLQNNTRTGHQALAVLLPVAPTPAAKPQPAAATASDSQTSETSDESAPSVGDQVHAILSDEALKLADVTPAEDGRPRSVDQVLAAMHEQLKAEQTDRDKLLPELRRLIKDYQPDAEEPTGKVAEAWSAIRKLLEDPAIATSLDDQEAKPEASTNLASQELPEATNVAEADAVSEGVSASPGPLPSGVEPKSNNQH